MELKRPFPFLSKLALVLFCLIAIFYIIYIGQDILVPIAFAVLLALLLLPLNNFLEKRIGRVSAILISLALAILIISIVIYFLSVQISGFIDDFPTLKKQVNTHIRTLQKWVFEQFHITRTEQTKYINEATAEFTDNKSSFIGATFLTITESLIFLVLLPIYTFLMLYYRDMIRKFLVSVFAAKHRNDVEEVISESRHIVHGYMVGLMIEMAIVAAINISGFLIVGIKYAFFLGMLAAILNLIPYIGMLIANIFCMLVTISTSNNLTDVLLVFVVLSVVQFIDNNIIMPKVVSSKVKINALITILGVLVGGAICGLAGMFLSIPIIAIFKSIFDRVEELKPWGELLGDEITYTHKGRLMRRMVEARKRKQMKNVK